MSERPRSRISRRSFLRAAGIGAAGLAASAGSGPRPAGASSAEDAAPDHTTDVIVLGTGAAGWAAAIFAHEAGAAVEILDKGAYAGGTTLKSGGVYWVPNNHVMRAHDMPDPREDALGYMARLSYPDQYSPDGPRLGLAPHDYAMIETFYERGAGVIEQLRDWGVTDSTFWPAWDGSAWTDYHAELPENRAPRGRGIVPLRSDGRAGDGADLIAAFRRGAEARQIPVRLRHTGRRLITNRSGEVVGLEVATPDGLARWHARRGVIFCTGGFAHNPELVRGFLRGVSYGSCEVPTNEGDFVAIASGVGAKLANMKSAAWKQVAVEQVLAFSSLPNGVAVIPGDSVLMVNRDGVRVVSEKLNYNQRGQVHFDWDAEANLYRNQFLFMIYDRRTAEQFAGMEPIPPAGVRAPEVLSAPSLDELARAIDTRLAELEPRIPRYRLASDFATTLARSVARFNEFARSGKDLDFARGETLSERDFHGPRRDGNDLPNEMMYPLSDTGPYYAIILAAGTYGTRGGPQIDPEARVLDASGQPIPGLYGAGNCIASPAGGGYWGGGSQLGPGIVFGAIAGAGAARGPARKLA